MLELYCGNGNFTLPLATRVRKVLATEISKTSVNAALSNLDENAVDNVALVRLSAEELAEALNEVRPVPSPAGHRSEELRIRQRLRRPAPRRHDRTLAN